MAISEEQNNGFEVTQPGNVVNFGNVPSSLIQLGSMFLQRYWNQKDYKQQVADNLAQWDRENEYNSPQAQMRRYMDAGLNPDMIYGQSNESGHTQVTPNLAHPTSTGALGSVAESLRQSQYMDAQIDLLRSEADKNRSDIDTNETKLQLATEELQLEFDRLDLDQQKFVEDKLRNVYLNDLDDARKREVEESILNYAKMREVMDSEISRNAAAAALDGKKSELVQKDIDNYHKKLVAELNSLYASAYRDRQSGEQSKAQAKLATRQLLELRQTFDERLQQIVNSNLDSEKKREELDALIKKHQADCDAIYFNAFTNYVSPIQTDYIDTTNPQMSQPAPRSQTWRYGNNSKPKPKFKGLPFRRVPMLRM